MPFGDTPIPPRQNDATIAARVEEVLQLRLEGKSFPKIVQFAANQGWEVHGRMLREYIKRADDLLIERQEKRRRRIIALHLARREELYDRSVTAGDNRTALAVLADTADIQSLYASDRDLKEIMKLATEQEERIKQLENQLREASKREASRPAAAETEAGSGGVVGDGLPQPAIVPA